MAKTVQHGQTNEDKLKTEAAPKATVARMKKSMGKIVIEQFQEQMDGSKFWVMLDVEGYSQPEFQNVIDAERWLKENVGDNIYDRGGTYRIIRVVREVTAAVETKVVFR